MAGEKRRASAALTNFNFLIQMTRELRLGRQSLKSVCLELYLQKNDEEADIDRVYLERNYLDSLSLDKTSSVTFSNLVILVLGVNNFTTFPDLSSAVQLKELYLNNNKIETLDTEVLTHLKEVSCTFFSC